MPQLVTALSIFLASPSDVSEERKLAREAIASLDEAIGETRKLCLRAMGWEKMSSDLGDPQNLINKYSERADLVVVIFHRKFGSPTANFASGTLEEFTLAMERWEKKGTPRVKIFFREVDEQTIKDAGPELSKVLEFKGRFWKQRLGLYRDYKDPKDFQEKFQKELLSWVDSVTLQTPTPTESTGGVRHATNLPLPVTPFIGREQALSELKKLLSDDDVQMVTLTGLSGIGKTSLAVHLAANLAEEYGSNVRFIDLGAVTDHQKVIPTIIDKLGITLLKDTDIVSSVKGYLRGGRMLLLLDNFDKVRAAAPQVGELLAAVPQLKAIVTCGVALHLSNEHKYPVPPLSRHEKREMRNLTPERALKKSSVELFVTQMKLHDPEFTLTSRNVCTVAEICSDTDGIPLAIKLAADSVGLRPLDEMSSRLKERLRQGVGKLQAVFMSTYDLLDASEKTVFKRLGVFVGGCTINAAEAVCNLFDDPELDVIDQIESLLEKGLLQQKGLPGIGQRIVMPNTIREFALAQLLAGGEAESTQQRHAEYFLEHVEGAEPKLTTGERESGRWLERLEAEHDNLRGALAWSQADPGRSELGLRLAGALFWFWNLQGYFEEGRQWVEKALKRAGSSTDVAAQARALYCAGGLAFLQGDYDIAKEWLEKSVDTWRALRATAAEHELRGVTRRLGLALIVLGMVEYNRRDLKTARRYEEESVDIFKNLGDEWGLALALNDLGNVTKREPNIEEARRLFEKSLKIWRKINEDWGLSLTLGNLGGVAFQMGDYRAARQLLEEALEIQRKRGDKWGIASSLNRLAAVFTKQPDYRQAASLYKESLLLHRELGRKHLIAFCMEGLASLACAVDECERAAILIGIADNLLEGIDVPQSRADSGHYKQTNIKVLAKLGQHAFEAARDRGHSMPFDEAMTYATEYQY